MSDHRHELYADVPGQAAAVATLRAAAARPVHAYLLIGPPGSGKRQAARSFAAALLGGEGEQAKAREVRRRVLGPGHPDVHTFERSGAFLSIDDARLIRTEAFRTPTEGHRKVILVPDLHLVRDAAPALLKTVEEPPSQTVMVLMAETVPPELITISSRCVVVHFVPLTIEVITDALVSRGVLHSRAVAAAEGSCGRMDRALLLASDESFADRQALWRGVPDRMDGSGGTVSVIAEDLAATLDGLVQPLNERHAREQRELDELDKVLGRKQSRKAVEDRQKREVRRVRTDELRAGLGTLSAVYRDRIAAGTASAEAAEALRHATEAIQRNPNEGLLLRALLLRLDRSRR